MGNPAPSVFAYFNYRDFLRDHFTFRKSVNRHYSHRAFAQKAGYNSSGLYLLLVNGKQNLTQALLPKFAQAMELNPKETEYLGFLVEFTHAKTGAAKQVAFEKMMAFLPERMKNIGREQSDYYRTWHNVAVREALAIVDVADDFHALAAFLDPPIKPSEAKAGVKLLAALGMIRKDKKGFWRATDASLASSPELGAVTIHHFQKTMMDMGKSALDRFPREERNISCSTFSISRQGLERVSLKIDALLSEIAALVRSDEKEDRIYQFNVQLFPLSGRKDA